MIGVDNKPTREGGRRAALKRRLATAGAFARYALHRFNRDGCFAASGALSYTTLVSLVPLGVIAVGILSMFPIFASARDELMGFLFRNFVPQVGEQAAYWFRYFADSAGQTTTFGVIGFVGTSILLLVTVEDQLNLLWRVTAPRPWVQRILAYWTLITLGPLLIGFSLSLSTYFALAARRAGFDPEALVTWASTWLHALAHLIPFVLELVTCTLLYCLIPNCAVRWRDGARGALIATVAIEILKIGFSIYIGAMSSYQTIYGAVAAIPILLLWLYLAWMAVLLGAVVAANLPNWRIDERVVHATAGGMRLGFSLALIAALARAQRRGRVLRTAALAAELGVATSVVDEHMAQLAGAGFTAHTQEGAWVLAWNPESATLQDLYEALGLPLAGKWTDEPVAPWQRQVSAAMERIITAEAAAMQVKIATLIEAEPTPAVRSRRPALAGE